jgi:hypothetical protein
MVRKNLLCIIAILALMLTIGSLQIRNIGAQEVMYPANAIWLDPGEFNYNQYNGSVGTMFNVTAWTNMSAASFTWQLSLSFDPAVLQCTRVGLTNGTISQFFVGHTTIPGAPAIDNSTGLVLLGESLVGTDSRSAGSDSLAWFEFEISAVPDANDTLLTSTLDIDSINTFMENPDLDVISSTIYSTNFTSNYIVDDTAPTIVNPTQYPVNGSVADGQAVVVSTEVTDNVDGSGVSNVTLYYSNDTVAWTDTPMTLNDTTGLWDGTIPGYPTGTTVYYNITASDFAGNMGKNDHNGVYWSYYVPEFASVLIVLMLIAMTGAAIVVRKRMIH